MGALDDLIAAFDPTVPVAAAATPPDRWYTDRRLLEHELATVFARGWQLAVPTAALQGPGTFATARLGRSPAVVVDDDGTLRAFHNVCRHHAAEVATGQGACEALVCPYHGWTYRLDGRLKSAPRMAGVVDFDRDATALRPMAVEEVGPFVMASPDPAAPSLRDRLGTLLERFDATGWKDLVHVKTVTYELACNWKVFVDNYLDGGYHVGHLHRGLAGQLDLDTYQTEIGDGWSLQSTRGAAASPDPAEDATTGADFRERIGEGALYAFVHPNLMINRYGQVLDLNVAEPLGVDRCRIRFEYFFAPEVAGDEAFVERSLAASDVVQQEDVGVCESVQRGLASGAYGVGRYAPRVEHAMHAFHCDLHRDLAAGLAEGNG